MSLRTTLRAFAVIQLCMGLMMLIPMALSIIGQDPNASSFFFGALICALTGLGALGASIGIYGGTDFRGTLIIILVWWALSPAFAAIPFALAGMAAGDAYFEAVCALTTTGGWLSLSNATENSSEMLWRAMLQWLGGFASISIAAAIFIRPSFIGIDTLLPPFSRGDDNNFVRPLLNAIKAFAGIYIGMTLLAALLFAFVTNDPLMIAMRSLSGVASGGFLSIHASEPPATTTMLLVTFFVMAFSGSNFVVIARMVRGSRQRARDLENSTLI